MSIIILLDCYSQANLPGYYDQFNNHSFASLELEDNAGNIIKTDSLFGKTIYVDFWFTACAPCIKEIPHAKALQQFFASDTSIQFVNICIENIQRKDVWRQMIRDKNITGINLFYALNRPQKVNLLRVYNIKFPTYLLVNKASLIIGYDVSRPSETGLVRWVIAQAAKGKFLSASIEAYNKSEAYNEFIKSSDTTYMP